MHFPHVDVPPAELHPRRRIGNGGKGGKGEEEGYRRTNRDFHGQGMAPETPFSRRASRQTRSRGAGSDECQESKRLVDVRFRIARRNVAVKDGNKSTKGSSISMKSSSKSMKSRRNRSEINEIDETVVEIDEELIEIHEALIETMKNPSIFVNFSSSFEKKSTPSVRFR